MYQKIKTTNNETIENLTDDLGEVGRALSQMPVLSNIRSRFMKDRPMDGARIAIVFHLTKEAAALALTVRAAGADTTFIPSKIATADPSVVKTLQDQGICVQIPDSEEQRQASLREVLDFAPHLMIDNAELFSLWHSETKPPMVLGSSVHSRSACSVIDDHVAAGKELLYPIISVGSSPIKLELESSYGTGQSVLASLIQITDMQINGKKIAIIGYGNVGSGLARFAHGMCAHVTIVQNSPYKALKAVMDGYNVCPLEEAIAKADIVVTATGKEGILQERQLRMLQDGTYIGNIGRSQEIDMAAIRRISQSSRKIDDNIEEFIIDNKRIYLMGDGHQFNHMAGTANSAEMMDISLALHAYGVDDLWRNRNETHDRVAAPISREVADAVAERKLEQLGFRCE